MPVQCINLKRTAVMDPGVNCASTSAMRERGGHRGCGAGSLVTGDAERIARGVLGKDFPDPADVQREIAALETQVAARLDARRVVISRERCS